MDDEQYFKAVLCAIRDEYIETMADVCKEKSSKELKGLNYYLILRGHNGEPIVETSLIELAQSRAPSSLDTTKEQAVAWAYSMGYDIPEKMDGCSQGCLIAIALFAFVIPGVVFIVWVAYKNNQYERDISALISKWIDAGRPEPGEEPYEESQLVRIEETTGSAPISLSTEARLQELMSMKENGFISDSEYETLRKKMLGL